MCSGFGRETAQTSESSYTSTGSQKNVKGFAPAGNETHSFRDVYFED